MTLVIVPGLGDSGADHWQTRWQHQYGAARVRQDTPDAPSAQAWAARLQEVIQATPGDLILVSHSLGGPTVAHWAQRYSPEERVRGALLVAPVDPDDLAVQAQYPVLAAMTPLPRSPLPFPAQVVASETDPYLSLARAQELATAWGAGFTNAGDAGHLNVASGHGDWSLGEALLAKYRQAWRR